MKKILITLFALLLIPISCSAISLNELQSNTNQYKNILEVSSGTIYINVNSIKSIRYAPPYYTLQVKTYIVTYPTQGIIESIDSFNYDYNRSVESLYKKIIKENPSISNQEIGKYLYSEAKKDCGINYSSTNKKIYLFNGELVTEEEPEFNKRVNYNTGAFNMANFIFKKYYKEDFIPTN